MRQTIEDSTQSSLQSSVNLPKVSSFKFIKQEGRTARGSVFSNFNSKISRPLEKAENDHYSTQATFAGKVSRKPSGKQPQPPPKPDSRGDLEEVDLKAATNFTLHKLYGESRLHTTGHLDPLEGDSGQVSSEYPPPSAHPLKHGSSLPKSLMVGDSHDSHYDESVADNDALEEELLGYNTAQQNRQWAPQNNLNETKFKDNSSRTDSMKNKVSIQLSIDSNRWSRSRHSQQLKMKPPVPLPKPKHLESICKLDSLEEQMNEGSSSSFITEHGWSK